MDARSKIVWDGVEYACRHQSVGSLRRVAAQTVGSPEYVLAIADMAAEMAPEAADLIETLPVDQLDRFITEAVGALEAAGPFPAASGGN